MGRLARRFRKAPFAAVAAMLAAASIGAVALAADNLLADGDGLAPVVNSDVAAGEIPCDETTTKNVILALRHSGNGEIFKNSTSVSVSGTSASDALTIGTGTINLPSAWENSSNGTLSNTTTVTVDIQPEVAGEDTATITFDATGTQDNGDSLTRSRDMEVTWDADTCPPSDSTPPVITKTVTPSSPDGDAGWYTSDVSVDWTVTEPDSAITSSSGCDDFSVTSDQNSVTYTCTATSAGGTSSDSVTIKRDATAPVITFRPAGDVCSLPGDNGWCRGTQTAGFAATDGTSGLADPTKSSFTQSTATNGSPVNISSGTITDNAGNVADAVNAGPYKIDSVDPTISGAPSPAANAAGWNNSDVTVTFTCGDVGGSGFVSCGPNQTLSDEGRDQSAMGNVTDNAGNTNTDTVSNIDIDKTDPSAPTAAFVPAVAYTDGDGVDWFRDSVTVSYGGSTDPDLNDPRVAFPNKSGSGVGAGGYSAGDSRSTSGTLNYSGTATDDAGNESDASSGTVKVDADDPTVTITGCPTAPVVTGSGGSVTVAASDGESGLVSDPSGTVPLDTSSIGSKTITRTVTDNVGHTDTASCTYSVIYDWDGFFRPIDNLPILNVVKAGSSVPVKFSLGGNQGLAIFAIGYPKSAPVTCSADAPQDSLDSTATAGQSTLSYDPIADQYNYVWKTEKGWAGSCRQLVVKLADDSIHRANFKLTK